MKAKSTALASLALVLLASAPAAADPAWRVTALGLFEAGPTKFVLAPGLHLRDVYHRDANPLFDKLHLDGGLELLANPTNPGGRAVLEWVPLAPVVLRATWTTFFYTGAPLGLGHGLSFPTSRSPFDAATLRARSGEEESEIVQRPALTLVLRLKLARLLAMSESEAAGWYVPTGQGDWWYEALYDVLVARGRFDATLSNRTVALIEAWRSDSGASCALGAVNEYVRAARAGLERDRVGGSLMVSLGDHWGLTSPTFVLMGGVTAIHRYRSGEPWMQLVVTSAMEAGKP
jgi:hypothetical protein